MFLLEGETQPARTLKLVRFSPTTIHLALEEAGVSQNLMSLYEFNGQLVFARVPVTDPRLLELRGVRTDSYNHGDGHRRYRIFERLG